MPETQTSLTLDRRQLRDVTLDDEDLMREILAELVNDTSHQLALLKSAIQAEIPETCMKLAHYSKGACANVGAARAADLLASIETQASRRAFGECTVSLASLALEVERLRLEMAGI